MIRSAGGGGEHQGEGARLEGTPQGRAQERTHRGAKEEGWRETESGGEEKGRRS